PVYIAREILNKEKYKISSDIYFWRHHFVISGKRIQKRESITQEEYTLILECWDDEQIKRQLITIVVQKLETINLHQ
ncbi:hypothetical protein EIN_283150, partial [Entamoeba invadens IP1]